MFHCAVVSLLNGFKGLGNERSRFVQVIFYRRLEFGRCHGSSERRSVIDVPGLIHFMGGLVYRSEEFLIRVSTLCPLKGVGA